MSHPETLSWAVAVVGVSSTAEVRVASSAALQREVDRGFMVGDGGLGLVPGVSCYR